MKPFFIAFTLTGILLICAYFSPKCQSGEGGVFVGGMLVGGCR